MVLAESAGQMVHHAADAGVLAQGLGRGQPDRQGGKHDEGGDTLDQRIGVADGRLKATNAQTGW